MSRSLIAGALFLSAASSGAWAQDEMIGVRVREWKATLEGKISADTTAFGGSTIDLADDLGLDAAEWSSELQVYGHIPFFGKLYGGWWRVHREGDEILTRTINFDGQVYAASTRVQSEVTLDVGYLTYEFDFPSIPLGDAIQWEIGLQLGARVMSAAGSLDSAVASGSRDGIIGIPVLGGHMALQVTRFLRADVELVGLTFSYGDHHGSYIEAYGEIVAQPFPWLFAGVGYKYVALEVSEKGGDNDFEVDAHISGFYLTAGVRF